MALVYIASGNYKLAEVTAGEDGQHTVEMFASKIDGANPVWVMSKFRLPQREAIEAAGRWVAVGMNFEVLAEALRENLRGEELDAAIGLLDDKELGALYDVVVAQAQRRAGIEPSH